MNENEGLKTDLDEAKRALFLAGIALGQRDTEIERLRAALTEITELDMEGDASLADALHIADEAVNPPPSRVVCVRCGGDWPCAAFEYAQRHPELRSEHRPAE